jgi:hypothetical protein
VFVADKEKDLSSGTLYVAKVGNRLLGRPGAAGRAAVLDQAGQRHQRRDQGHGRPRSSRPTSWTSRPPIRPTPATPRSPPTAPSNWVKVVPGMEKAAAFLETHRYAALKGGSMGFTKMEGTTVNAKDKIAYSALPTPRWWPARPEQRPGGISIKA